MNWKYVVRTLRNAIVRERPYFASRHHTSMQSAVPILNISEERFEGLDLSGMKRIIDVLDHLGVAVLSISGGGEPLLRKDFAAIVNYAGEKRMYTKLTSNGTMPWVRYIVLVRRFLRSASAPAD